MRKLIYGENSVGSLLQGVNKKFKQENKPFSMVSKTAFKVSTGIQSFVVEWQLQGVDMKIFEEKTVQEISPIFYLH